MLAGIIFIVFGVSLVWLLLDFLLICGADIHKFGDKWLLKTLWLWLPIHALIRLTREVILKKK